jgi:hypothetical protein
MPNATVVQKANKDTKAWHYWLAKIRFIKLMIVKRAGDSE